MSRTVYTEIQLAGEPFYLLPQRAMFRPLKKQLILSDVHLGKATHFRKMGIPMPAQSHLRDIDALHFLMDRWQPDSCIILGDLFHSDYNREWLWFKAVLAQYAHIQFFLVEGNHDVLHDAAYEIVNLIKTEVLEEEQIIFSHHPLSDVQKLNICGHIHPGIRLYGLAKQSVTLPCFYYNRRQFILPAFGNLTGLFLLDREDFSLYYLVTGNKVVQLTP